MTGSTANGPGDSATELGANGDECPWCRTADPSMGDTCKNCGRPIGPATSIEPVPAATSWPPPPQPAAAPQRPAVVVPVVDPIVTARQSETSEFQLLEAEDEMGPSRSWVMLGWVAVAAATIGVLAIVLLSGDSDGGATPDTLPPVVSTSSVPEGATTAPPPATTPPTSALAPLPSPIPTTISPATSPATAVPVTNPLTTTPPATAAPATPPPATAPPPSTTPPATNPPATSPATSAQAPPPPSGPGSPQVLNDPLPSGVTPQAVAPAFTLGQRLADALAGGDWDTVREIDVDSRQTTDESFQTGYGGLDQASLMLLDAKPEGEGHRLLVVSVAIELGGSRTSIYCLEWSSDPDAGAIDQHGGAVGLVARVARPMSPEEVRQDASLDSELRTECVWIS